MKWVLALLLITGCAGTSGGKQIDDWCVAGQVRDESRDWINENRQAWKQHTQYQAPIESGDRIVSRHCSEVLIALGAGDFAAAMDSFRKARANDDDSE